MKGSFFGTQFLNKQPDSVDRSLIGDPAGQLATNLPALLRPGRRRSPAYLIVGETYFR
jgi:hypothetical protein